MSGTVDVFEGLKSCGINFIASVPCINLSELIHLVQEDPWIKHVPVTREEEGIGICAGAYMGGMRPALLMQNSGLGNSINALASLNQLYGIPLLMIISHRGMEDEQIKAQVPMGRLTGPLLRTMKISTYVLDKGGQGKDSVINAWDEAVKTLTPVAVLVKPSFWGQG